MDVSLDVLRTFLAVYRRGCITGAAQQLGLAQATVSAQLRQLEHSLGRPLFRRLARAVEPTREADRLALRLTPSLDRIETLLAGPATPGGFTRAVRLGGPEELTGAVLVPALANLVGEGLRLTVTVAGAAELHSALACGELDLVLSREPPRDGVLRGEHVGDSELVLVARADWARRIGTPVRPDMLAEALAEVPLVDTTPHGVTLADYCAQVRVAGLQRHADLVLPDARGVRSAVLAGAGVAVLPHYLCGRDLARNMLHAVCVPPRAPVCSLYLARQTNAAPVLAVEAVRSRILWQGRVW